MSELYKATSPKNPDTNYTEAVVFEQDSDGNPTRSIRVGGAAVELSEKELEIARKYLNVRKATDEEEKAQESPEEVDKQSANEAAVADQTSTVPLDARIDPAAAEARTEINKSRRGGGDK
jgi:hypothetical protein